MSLPELHPHIWAKVIGHLKEPLPAPTGKQPWSAIRQNSLAAMMRVSKSFNNLTGPILYNIIITDHLPTLLYNLNQPASASGIKSKTELLSLITRLFLEYIDKEEPTYPALLSHGSDFFGLFQPNVREMLVICGAEADWIADSAKLLNGIPKGLISLSTGAFCGGQRLIWKPIWGNQLRDRSVQNVHQRIIRANGEMTSLVTAHKRKAYFCNRVDFGPLTFITVGSDGATTEPGWKGAKGLEHRLHLDDEPGMIPAITGGKSRWYATMKGVMEYPEMHSAVAVIAQTIGTHIEGREMQMRQLDPVILNRMAKAGKAASFELDIYLPPRFMVPDVRDFLRMLVDEAVKSKLAEMKVPMMRTPKDVINLKRMGEAPTCEACGWIRSDQ